jgi:eukaryotic-like serine/threonine-protein kinase
MAKGGMASVWLARMTGKHGFQKLVAVKTILPEHAGDLAFHRMLLDEARIASGIHHGNVAEILDLGEQDGVLYIVLEWVDGESLKTITRTLQQRGQGLPFGVALRVVADVCGAAHVAHELCDESGAPLNVIHRDISPHNVLLGRDGVAKLIDFGIAKARGRLTRETTTGLLKGKIDYMSPEQALAKPVDRRADIWALGALLHYLLRGGPPYIGKNDVDVLESIVNDEPPQPLPGDVPQPVVVVIERAMAHDRADRFPTAAAMQEALEETMASTGTVTGTATVAAFVTTYLQDLTVARERAVAAALSAVGESAGTARGAAPAKESSSRLPAAHAGKVAPEPRALPPILSALPERPSRRRARLWVAGVVGFLGMAFCGALVGRVHYLRTRHKDATSAVNVVPVAESAPPESPPSPPPEASDSAAPEEAVTVAPVAPVRRSPPRTAPRPATHAAPRTRPRDYGF